VLRHAVHAFIGANGRRTAARGGDFQPRHLRFGKGGVLCLAALGGGSLSLNGWSGTAGSDGTATAIVDGLNQPTSLEFIAHTTYIVSLGGEVWVVEKAH
jgi:hypothetical protein